MHRPPFQASAPIDDDYLDDIAAAFAQVIDSNPLHRRAQRARHSLYRSDRSASGLHRRAAALAQRAALLHDIGKLGVSNTILDKPGKLDDAEWVERCACTPSIRNTSCRASPPSANWLPSPARITSDSTARAIPRGLLGDQISLETRIITTADIFHALTADRPYRCAMPITKALAIMSEMVGTQIDADCCAALKRALGRIDETLTASPCARYE